MLKRNFACACAAIGSLLALTAPAMATIYFDDGSVVDANVGTLSDPFDPIFSTAFGTGNPTASDVEAWVSSPVTLFEVYKANQDGASPTADEEGPQAGDYQTEYGPDPGDPSDATIKWVGPGIMTGSPIYLLAKGGGSVGSTVPGPSVYVWEVPGTWDGKEWLNIVDMWPNQGAISHIAFYSAEQRVPDGGASLALLGISLLGVSLGRRISRR